MTVFDGAGTTPSTAPMTTQVREKESTTPRPMLIHNMGISKGVRRVGNMVFDPVQFCWLKVDHAPSSRMGEPMETIEDEDDPFRDIPDLEDRDPDATDGHVRVSDMNDDWIVGEEFDVGPEFIRRQREEEERWRKKCEKWIGTVERDTTTWKWAIRDLVLDS